LNASPSAAIVAFLLRKPHIALEDSFNMEQVRLYLPFTTVVFTSSYPHTSLGKKEIRYDGFQELAYLHPNYFKPNSSAHKILGLQPDEKYVVLRFVSWSASHDIGQIGIDYNSKIILTQEIRKHNLRVFISSEDKLPEMLNSYKLSIDPDCLHEVLAGAELYIGEGGTTATECAMMGVPNVLINKLAKNVGNHQELKKKYNLQYYFDTIDEAMPTIIKLLTDKTIKSEFRNNRDRLLKDKIDLTRFLIWFIEDYPESLSIMKKNPERQLKFK